MVWVTHLARFDIFDYQIYLAKNSEASANLNSPERASSSTHPLDLGGTSLYVRAETLSFESS